MSAHSLFDAGRVEARHAHCVKTISHVLRFVSLSSFIFSSQSISPDQRLPLFVIRLLDCLISCLLDQIHDMLGSESGS
jgi:hypothetical protein